MGRELLKTVQIIATFRNPLADPMGTRRGPPLWSADPSLKTAALQGRRAKSHVDTPTIQPRLGDFVLRGDGPRASTSCASEAARVKAELDYATLWVCFA